MNKYESLRIPDNQNQLRAEAHAMFDKWEQALPRFGHREDYWQRIIEQAGQYVDQNPDADDYCRLLMAGRIEALEAEWRMLHPVPAGNALKEAVDGKV